MREKREWKKVKGMKKKKKERRGFKKRRQRRRKRDRQIEEVEVMVVLWKRDKNGYMAARAKNKIKRAERVCVYRIRKGGVRWRRRMLCVNVCNGVVVPVCVLERVSEREIEMWKVGN